MAEGGDHAAQEHHPVVGGEGGRHVPCDEQDHQARQDRFAGQPRRRGRHRDRADRDGQGVSGDQPARRGLGDVEVAGHLRQQAGDHELGQTDAEAAEGQGDQPGRHTG